MEENLKQYSLLNLGKSVLRIAFYGPESTGKTTLARQLASDFDTVWAPEFARDYLQEKWDEKGEICQPDDLLPIAVGQTQLENQKLQEARRFLFCDTTVLVTKAFGEFYYGAVDPLLEKAAKKHKYDLIFLTDIDVPWEPDDLRDRPHNRAETLQFFEEQLIRYQKPYIKLSGDVASRVAQVKQLILDLEKALQWGFTSHDFLRIQARKMDWDVLHYQFSILKNGLPKIQLERAATIDDGIQALSEEEARYYATYFEQKKESYCLKKFVPASGAASRMFKFLNEFLHDFKPGKDTLNSYINHAKNKDLALFLIALEKFPFYKDVAETTRVLYPSYDTLSADEKHYYFIKTLMTAPQFDFANKPKGVLPFHQQGEVSITPIEEHLLECALYAHADGKSKVHFTVSEEYQSQFETLVDAGKAPIETTHGITIQVT